MSFSDDSRDLIASFQNTRQLLEQLLQALRARRAAWVSARPSTLEPSPELERLTQALAHEEASRAPLLDRLRDALPQPFGYARERLHVNTTLLAAAMAPADGKALREAADVVQRLAKNVRAEVTLGQRLVRFARDATATALPGNARSRELGYDRRARTLHTSTAGALVDGRI